VHGSLAFCTCARVCGILHCARGCGILHCCSFKVTGVLLKGKRRIPCSKLRMHCCQKRAFHCERYGGMEDTLYQIYALQPKACISSWTVCARLRHCNIVVCAQYLKFISCSFFLVRVGNGFHCFFFWEIYTCSRAIFLIFLLGILKSWAAMLALWRPLQSKPD
jgi:hypothetical protein